jgi:hypothetical protein
MEPKVTPELCTLGVWLEESRSPSKRVRAIGFHLDLDCTRIENRSLHTFASWRAWKSLAIPVLAAVRPRLSLSVSQRV